MSIKTIKGRYKQLKLPFKHIIEKKEKLNWTGIDYKKMLEINWIEVNKFLEQNKNIGRN